MHTFRSACAFPTENEYSEDEDPARFPIAAVLPWTQDLYENPNWDSSRLESYRSYRKESSRLWEQIVVLVAMALHQAKILDSKRFQIKDPRLDDFEVLFVSEQI